MTETKIVEDVTITGNAQDGYSVSHYEYQQGKGRDCGLNVDGPTGMGIDEAREYAEALNSEYVTTEQLMICGSKIQLDKSGVGHCWVAADGDCPASIQEEIAGEIIDGGNDDCDDYVASNGVHYRW